MKKYKAANGATFGNGKAQIYGARLDVLREENGRLTPSIVVNDAKKATSPLHEHFEWNADVAADKFRLLQARQMINCIVEVVVIEGKQKEFKSWFNVKDSNKENIYVSIKEAVKTPSYKTQILNDLITELEHTTNLMKTFKKLISR